MAAPAPVYRGQGNQPFQAFQQDRIHKRGQTVPYDNNGSPTLPPEPGAFIININDLPTADPTKPLLEFETPISGLTFNGADEISAGVAATAPSALLIYKDGVANGTITLTGTGGVAAFTDSSYTAGELFSLYPPASIDATLDRVRITLGVD